MWWENWYTWRFLDKTMRMSSFNLYQDFYSSDKQPPVRVVSLAHGMVLGNMPRHRWQLHPITSRRLVACHHCWCPEWHHHSPPSPHPDTIIIEGVECSIPKWQCSVPDCNMVAPNLVAPSETQRVLTPNYWRRPSEPSASALVRIRCQSTYRVLCMNLGHIAAVTVFC